MENDHKNYWKQQSYKYPLIVSLKELINKWKNDREKSWKTPSVSENIQKIINDLEELFGGERPLTKKEIFEIVEELSECFKITKRNLAESKALKKIGGKINYLYEISDLYKYTEENLEAYLLEEAIEEANKAANRLMTLEHELFIIEKLHLTQSVADFLRLVTRCYIWGFDAECVILCRSAVEQAIKDKVTYDMCEKHLGPPIGNGYSLKSRLIVAKKEGIINNEIDKIAYNIRERGNKALHEDPYVTNNILGTIKEAIKVIAYVMIGEDPFPPPPWLDIDRRSFGE